MRHATTSLRPVVEFAPGMRLTQSSSGSHVRCGAGISSARTPAGSRCRADDRRVRFCRHAPLAVHHSPAVVVIPLAMLAAVLAAPVATSAQCQLPALAASDASQSDIFGHSVAVGDTTAIIGAPNDDDAGDDAGAAYVFRRSAPPDLDWAECAKLTASDSGAGDQFGWSVAVHGGMALVGAHLADGVAFASGAAYVFRRDDAAGSGWIEEERLIAPDGDTGAFFGGAVAVGENIAVVGARLDGDPGGDAGAVYVFRYDAGGWSLEQKIIASDAATGDQFGRSVAVAGPFIVVGAPGRDGAGADSGAAYVFRHDVGRAAWVEEQRVTASDAAAGDLFGVAVALDSGGNQPPAAVIGARLDDGSGSGLDAGAGYVFRRVDKPAAPPWIEEAKLTASEPEDFAEFGTAVAVSGADVLVGAHRSGVGGVNAGAVFAFHHNGDAWVATSTLTASDAQDGDWLGYAVAVDGTYAIAGARFADTAAPNAGAAYVFALGPDSDADGVIDDCDNCAAVSNADQLDSDQNGIGDACNARPCESQKLTASDGASDDRFGAAVAVRGGVAVVGAPRVDDGNVDAGAAYVFRRLAGQSGSQTEWVQEQRLTALDATENASFGHASAVDGDVAIIASGGADASAYVFRYDPAVGLWAPEQTLTVADGADDAGFGASVAIRADGVVVGQVRENDAGVVHVFRYDPNAGVWAVEQVLAASDATEGDGFGSSVSMGEGIVIVGAPLGDDAPADLTDSGSAYVFRREDNQWIQEQKLSSADAASGDQFGNAVSVDGDTLAVGAFANDGGGFNSGAAYVFRRAPGTPKSGAVWTMEQKLIAFDADAGDRFGWSVAVSGINTIVGAYLNDDAGVSSGSAYLFRYNGSAWITEQKLAADDGAGGDFFGFAVAVSGETAFVGAMLDDDSADASGSTYLYTLGPDIDQDTFVDVCDNCPTRINVDQSDCDDDGVGDACADGGDFNGDGAVDLTDFVDLTDCASGDGLPPTPSEPACGDACIGAFDFDADGDVDLRDFGSFQHTFAGG